jgi:hypothetical protein
MNETINRRFAIKLLGGASLGSVLPLYGKPLPSQVQKKNIPNPIIKTDVLVIGGGTAGVIAAIQAARAGVSTMLVESGSQLGGTITTGGVAFPGLFHAWGKQVIGGIGWELVTDTVNQAKGKLPDFSVPTGRQHWRHQIRLNQYLYAMIAEEKCLEAGVSIRYYEVPVSTIFNGGNWEVETVGKGTRTKISCSQLIDCTGNANVVSLAGLKLLREEETQPGTQMFEISGYQVESLDIKKIQARFEEEVKKGNLLRSDARGNIASILNSRGDNAQHVLKADSSTSETHTQTNINGRASLLRIFRFLQTCQGCENIQLTRMQPETSVRETYRIDGEYLVTHKDYVEGRIFDDALAFSFYPIDLHDANGIIPKHLQEGTVATIPLRALIPKNSKNLMVAGRCISSDRLANSALRVQASCMAMGQIAGATASLAAKKQQSPIAVPIADIKSVLTQHGAIVP